MRTFNIAPHRYAVEVVAFDGEPPCRTTMSDPASAMSIYVEKLGEMDEMEDDDPDFLGAVSILRQRGGDWEDVTDWCITQHQKAGKYLYL